MEYSGFVCKDGFCYGTGGGHSTTFTDAVFKLDLSTGEWSEEFAPTRCDDMTRANYDEDNRSWNVPGQIERPASHHTYNMLQIVNGELIDIADRAHQNGGCAP